MSSWVDGTVIAIQMTCDKAASLFDWAERNAPEVANSLIDFEVNRMLVPDSVKDTAKEQLKSFFNSHGMPPIRTHIYVFREAISLVREQVKHLGSPAKLRHEASEIENSVVKPLEGLALTLNLANIPSALISNWNDQEANQRYQNKIHGRDTALMHGKEKASAVAEGLYLSADAIESFLSRILQLVISLHGFILSLVVAIVTSWTGVGLVVGIVGALVSVFNGISNLIGVFNDTSHEVESAKRALKQDVGSWPKAFA